MFVRVTNILVRAYMFVHVRARDEHFTVVGRYISARAVSGLERNRRIAKSAHGTILITSEIHFSRMFSIITY